MSYDVCNKRQFKLKKYYLWYIIKISYSELWGLNNNIYFNVCQFYSFVLISSYIPFIPDFINTFFSFLFVFAVLSLIVISTSELRNSLWQKQSIPGKITTFGINTAMSLKHLISMDAENILFAKGILTLNRHSQSNSGLIDDQNNLGMYSKT